MTWLGYQFAETNLISPFVYLTEILALGPMLGGMDLTRNRHMFDLDQIPLSTSSFTNSFRMYTKLVVRTRVQRMYGGWDG